MGGSTQSAREVPLVRSRRGRRHARRTQGRRAGGGRHPRTAAPHAAALVPHARRGRLPQGRVAAAHGVVQAPRRADEARLAHGGGARTGRHRSLGREPRRGSRVRRSRGGYRRARRHVRRRERGQGRRRAHLRRPHRPAGDGAGRTSSSGSRSCRRRPDGFSCIRSTIPWSSPVRGRSGSRSSRMLRTSTRSSSRVEEGASPRGSPLPSRTPVCESSPSSPSPPALARGSRSRRGGAGRGDVGRGRRSTLPLRARSRRRRSRRSASSPYSSAEEEFENGFRFLYERAKLACEPAGAAAVAARARRQDRRRPDRLRRLGRERLGDGRPLVSWPAHEIRHPSRVRPRARDAARAATSSGRVRRSPSSTWRSAPSATRSTRASRSSSIPAVGWSASSAGSRRPARTAATSD